MNAEQLSKLLDRKFGTHRGRNSRACKALNIQASNLSSALSGSATFPQKHITTLNALPDYIPPSGITQDIDADVNQLITWFTARLTASAASDLEFIARVHTLPTHHMPDLSANEAATARLMEIIFAQYREYLYESDPGACVATNRQIKREREEAKRQLSLELKDRKHLVADELTENEILDEDPLA